MDELDNNTAINYFDARIELNSQFERRFLFARQKVGLGRVAGSCVGTTKIGDNCFNNIITDSRDLCRLVHIMVKWF